MATYLPNVKEYIPQTETFTPDYKFLNDVLSVRQDRYDTNYKQMNNLYGSVVHADVSREDSKNTRDQYVNQLAPKLQQISGLDLSLQQNVDTAKALFSPFYEDKNLVRDIVFTKKWKSEMANAQNLKDSDDEATAKKYWDAGIQKLQYDMEDFVNASSEDMMNKALPHYVNKYDVMGEGLAKIKELDPNVESVSFSDNGMWKITMKNGSLLTRQPMGKNKEGEMQYSNPIGDYLSASLLNDPRALDYYRTKGYVEARSFYDKNKEQYGDKQAGMNAWGDKFLQEYGAEEDKIIGDLEQKETVLKGHAASWKNTIKEYGLTEGSKIDQAVKNTTAEYEAIKKSKEIRKDRNRKLNEGPSDNLTKALSKYMSFHMLNDINETANLYASTHGEVDIELSPLAKIDIDQQNRMALEEYKQNNRKLMKLFEYSLENPPEDDSSGLPATQEYFQGNQNNSSLLELQRDHSQSTRNDLAFAQELKEDDAKMLDLVTNWFISENSLAGREDIGVVNLCPSGTCGGNNTTDLRTIREELAKGNNDPLETAYGVMKHSYEQLVLSEDFSAMGQMRGDLLHNTGQGINFLTARDAMHTEGQRLRRENALGRYNFLMKKDDGDYKQLVEQADGLNIFRENQDGSITELGRTAFEEAFIEEHAFEDYLQTGQNQALLMMGVDGPTPNYQTDPYPQPATDFNTFTQPTRSMDGEWLRPLERVVSFSPELARQAAAEIYEKMQAEMDAVAADGDGSEESMLSFSLASWYDFNDQTGSGDNITPDVGGAYDHHEKPSKNRGLNQVQHLMKMMREEQGDMIVEYGTMETMARLKDRKGQLKDTNTNTDARYDLDQVYLGLSLSEAEGTKESRPQLFIKYNVNGPVYTNPDTDEETRYSVYEIKLDNTYSTYFDQREDKEGNDPATNAFQRNQHTISVFVPKGKYYNSHDAGKRQHPWQMTLHAKETNKEIPNPSVSNPNAGTITISKEADTYYLTASYKIYNPDLPVPGLELQLPQITALKDDNGNPYTDARQFEALQRDLDTILRNLATQNQNAEELHNKTIK